ncbi:MAG: DNA repair protein RecN [Eubacterium sp.]|nr:DNA repair protein RecN [Eubacterium sp.]
MINHISIKNFAIIEDAEISFNKGLNIITGESGSGKSIVVEAMSLALGSRADSSFIRTGADKAVIQMVAEYMHTEYIITRELSSNGKNLCKINGEIVTLAQLQQLTSKIADIHGQYDNQSLLNPDCHIDLVDKYEKSVIEPYKEKVSEYFHNYVDITKQINQKRQELAKFKEQQELMEYQLNEINMADLKIGEDSELQEKLLEEQNKEKIFNGFDYAYSLCSNDDNSSILSQLDKIQNSLKNIKSLSREAGDLEYEFSDLYYRLDDTFSKLRQIRDRLSYSASDLDYLYERLDVINSLKRKYGETIDDILLFKEKLEKNLSKIQDFDLDINSIKIEQERIGEMLKSSTETLSNLRRRSAQYLEEKISKELRDLNFNNVEISMQVTNLEKYTANGIDKIEFLISTNIGEPLKPLAKIASGGEMSRIMLAFKNVIGEYDGIGSMIFDEIDTGISGQAASVVGKKLLEISNKHQIISITHLPQIAALGNHNYKIEKVTENDNTITNIRHLTDKEKVEEIARLLSGDMVTDIAIENAKSLIPW